MMAMATALTLAAASLSWLALSLRLPSGLVKRWARVTLRMVLALPAVAVWVWMVWLATVVSALGMVVPSVALWVMLGSLVFVLGAAALLFGWRGWRVKIAAAPPPAPPPALPPPMIPPASAATGVEAEWPRPAPVALDAPVAAPPVAPAAAVVTIMPVSRSWTVVVLAVLAIALVALHLVAVEAAARQGDAAMQALQARAEARYRAIYGPPPVLPAGAADAVHRYVQLEQEIDGRDPPFGADFNGWSGAFSEQIEVNRRPAATTRLTDPQDDGSEAASDGKNAGHTAIEFLDATADVRRRLIAISKQSVYSTDDTPHFVPNGEVTDPRAGSVMEIQVFANYLTMDARCRIEQGRYAEAVEDLEATDAMADQLTRRSSGLIPALVAMAVRGIDAGAAEELLARQDAPEKVLKEWKVGGARNFRSQMPGVYAAVARQALVRVRYRDLMAAAARKSPDRDWEAPFLINPYVYRLARGFLDPKLAADELAMIGRVTAAAQTPFEPVGAAAPSPALSRDRIIRIVESADASVRKQATVVDAFEALDRLAVAVDLYRLKHGAYPATLQALVPEFLPAIPADPFGGKPLKMRSVPGGVVLFSVGWDGNEKTGARGASGSTRDWDQNASGGAVLAVYLGKAYDDDLKAFRAAWAKEHPAATSAASGAALGAAPGGK
ncbi:MAG: hypothetical protein ACREJ2_02660 [Planctomycetota bacterium]